MKKIKIEKDFEDFPIIKYSKKKEKDFIQLELNFDEKDFIQLELNFDEKQNSKTKNKKQNGI